MPGPGPYAIRDPCTSARWRPAGQSSAFEIVLDGECTQEYWIDGTIVK
ncbi:MAG: hypothetical protein WC626_06320 [Methanoregula sp.]